MVALLNMPVCRWPIDAGATEIFVIVLNPATEEVIPTEYTTLLPLLARTIDIFSNEVGRNDLLLPLQFNTALTYIDNVKNKMLAAGIPQNEVDSFFRMQPPFPLFQDKKPLKIYEIRPQTPLGGGPGGLNFDPAEMKQMLDRGVAAATDFFNTLPAGTTFS